MVGGEHGVAHGESYTGVPLEVESLSVAAGAFRLDGVSFGVPALGRCVVVGPAGAGKTTLLETIAGVRVASSGAVRLGGHDVTRLPAEARGVGLVYQHAYLFPHLSVAANVNYGAAEPGAAAELLRRLGVDGLARRGVEELSGGERQLVALARALAARPRLLLLDEPFGALDPGRRRMARRVLGELQREWSLTTVHVTHDLAEAEAVGDTMVVLDGGRVRQVGEPGEVMRRPASAAVASFLGAENVLPGAVSGAASGLTRVDVGGIVLSSEARREPGPVHVVIRAADLHLRTSHDCDAPEASGHLPARVVELERAGAGSITVVTLESVGVRLMATLASRRAEELGLHVGAEAWVGVDPAAVHLC